MGAKQLEAFVRKEGDAAIIDLHGDISAFAETVLNQAYNEAAEYDSRVILLNFTGVDYINSTGIALIVNLLAQARNRGVTLLASGVSDHYVEIFRLTRLTDFMSIYPDEATARASVGA